MQLHTTQLSEFVLSLDVTAARASFEWERTLTNVNRFDSSSSSILLFSDNSLFASCHASRSRPSPIATLMCIFFSLTLNLLLQSLSQEDVSNALDCLGFSYTKRAVARSEVLCHLLYCLFQIRVLTVAGHNIPLSPLAYPECILQILG